MAIGRKVPTMFIAMNAPSDWVLEWALELINMNYIPLVNSISYRYFLLLVVIDLLIFDV